MRSLLSLLFRFFRVDLVARGIIRDVINLLRGPVGDYLFREIFEDFGRFAFERIAIAGAAAAESEQQIALVVNFGSAGDQLEFPVTVDGAVFEDVAADRG